MTVKTNIAASYVGETEAAAILGFTLDEFREFAVPAAGPWSGGGAPNRPRAIAGASVDGGPAFLRAHVNRIALARQEEAAKRGF
jgi:hypothetical protein